ncbi:purine-nucleoside phosphorylase [Chitinophaga nivalis]|uniref:Purine nucleoside phosphorylase n=1 Tax=Chitinophaga nivalis TaxID=2991709 RepID=A0ABT3ITB5_9BACT|nr:purine-nucleoside phosphorylase [Chitinophaga nivalis]MCW3463092.1 purine-nucleoside phosphorylase [Chitinophaga nivalis]MCW3487218.1 purine-nucleoside phosphorylase [Chitinophaga nivalis]
MDLLLEQIAAATAYLQSFSFAQPRVGVVLGTGLGELVKHITIAHSIPYQQIPHFPESTVESHKGHLILGHIGTTPVIAMQGRFHYYEGYTMQQITFPVRVMKALGIEQLLLSNAAGGMNPAYKKGSLVLLDDHINMQPENPLRGLNSPAFGPRFPDMSRPYDPVLGQKLQAAATALGAPLQSGVYVSVMGPNLETRAEYRFLRMIGADLVGMSTVPEVIVANQLQLPCAAVSVVTDECDPDNLHPVSIEEIIAVAGTADKLLSSVFAQVIAAL